jgi:hypothetical protein
MTKVHNLFPEKGIWFTESGSGCKIKIKKSMDW